MWVVGQHILRLCRKQQATAEEPHQPVKNTVREQLMNLGCTLLRSAISWRGRSDKAANTKFGMVWGRASI